VGNCLELKHCFWSIVARIGHFSSSALFLSCIPAQRSMLTPRHQRIGGINRSPHLWGPNAATFTPERWIDAKTGKASNTGGQSSNYAQSTFLHGPRSCIGERFARSELKTLMAVFVGRFVMEMADRAEVPVPAGAITTKPRDGMRLNLKIIEGW
jgi:hypothetical protein